MTLINIAGKLTIGIQRTYTGRCFGIELDLEWRTLYIQAPGYLVDARLRKGFNRMVWF